VRGYKFVTNVCSFSLRSTQGSLLRVPDILGGKLDNEMGCMYGEGKITMWEKKKQIFLFFCIVHLFTTQVNWISVCMMIVFISMNVYMCTTHNEWFARFRKNLYGRSLLDEKKE